MSRSTISTPDRLPTRLTVAEHVAAVKPFRDRLAEVSKPTLAENDAENVRMTYAGRGMPALRHAKIFDHTRLEESPLFKQHERKLF